MRQVLRRLVTMKKQGCCILSTEVDEKVFGTKGKPLFCGTT
jgi:hypothetical protein